MLLSAEKELLDELDTDAITLNSRMSYCVFEVTANVYIVQKTI